MQKKYGLVVLRVCVLESYGARFLGTRGPSGVPDQRQLPSAFSWNDSPPVALRKVKASATGSCGAAEGNGSALSAIANEALAYVDGLHNLARYPTGNETDAEGLVQETYAHALRAQNGLATA